MFNMNLQLFAGPDDILLGEGVFAIGTVDIALTRGGGKFIVEREFRPIPADGDMGPVKGRQTKTKSVPKLTMNALELLPANLPNMYAATKVTTVTTTDTFTGKADIEDADYQTVTWTGKTKGGRGVKITLDNAINLENIDWSLIDKDEVIASLTYTGAYTEADRITEPWKVEFTGA
jgi:hypothetical protein